MPELPEVETIRRDLEKKVVGRTITKVTTDWPKTVAEPEFQLFEGLIGGKKIKAVKRRAKNLIITLSCHSEQSEEPQFLLIHFKMTGHMIVADADKLHGDHWDLNTAESALADRVNQFIHLVFYLDDGRVMALSDMRKFARVSLISKERLDELMADLGPEPLETGFTFEVFKRRLAGKKGPIKKVLLEQNVFAGIGNIYADEILFESKIAPQRLIPDLSADELNKLYKNIIKILSEAVELRGTSISDYRDASGEKGGYADVRKVYRRTGEPCPGDCGGAVIRTKIAGRSCHYCPKCQK